MAARKNSIPTMAALTAEGIRQAPGVVVVMGRATDVYRAFALILSQGRAHITTEINGVTVADWAGKSQAYRDWTGSIYAGAKITDKATLRRVQSSVRNHVSEVNREVMKAQGIDFALYGMDEASQANKQKNNAAKSIVRGAKSKPGATSAALVTALVSDKGAPADGAVTLVNLMHNQLIELSKSSIQLDQQAPLADMIGKLIATATRLQNRLVGTATPARTRKAA